MQVKSGWEESPFLTATSLLFCDITRLCATKSMPDVFINNKDFLSRSIWLPDGV